MKRAIIFTAIILSLFTTVSAQDINPEALIGKWDLKVPKNPFDPNSFDIDFAFDFKPDGKLETVMLLHQPTYAPDDNPYAQEIAIDAQVGYTIKGTYAIKDHEVILKFDTRTMTPTEPVLTYQGHIKSDRLRVVRNNVRNYMYENANAFSVLLKEPMVLQYPTFSDDGNSLTAIIWDGLGYTLTRAK